MTKAEERTVSSGEGNTIEAAHPGVGSAAFGVAAVFVTLTAWTIAPILIEYFSSDIDLHTSNGWRYGMAALVWSPMVVVLALRGRVTARMWKLALIPSLFNSMGQVCFVGAFYETTPAFVAFGLRPQIIAVALIAFFFVASERRVVKSPGFIVGAAMVILGIVAVVALKPAGAADPGDSPVLGVLLAAAAGVCFACYAFSIKKIMTVASAMLSYALISTITAGVMIAVMLLFAERSGAAAFELSGMQWSLLVVSSLVALCLGHTAYFAGIKRIGVAASTSVIQLQPFTVAVASMLLGYDALTGWQWGAGVVAVAGAMVILRAQHRLRRASKRAHADRDAAHTPPGPASSAGVGCEDAVPDADGDEEPRAGRSADPVRARADAEPEPKPEPASTPCRS
jgi:drug/metabolite transporter (DMT)-like permease